ncbi:MAG: PQQ-like beta-propeller repeat protein [Armatimonadaceae bacterium]
MPSSRYYGERLVGMNSTKSLSRLLAAGALCGILAAAVVANDWPQWRGPERTGHSKEAGLLKAWAATGPKLVWKSEELGEGHTHPSVAKGKIFGMGLIGDEEVVWALEEKTGKILWKTRIAGRTELTARQGGYGSRATPTVDGEKIYIEGVGGDVVCLNAADGKVLWSKNLQNDFGGSLPRWGYSESPLIDGNKVVVTPGGNGATLVALDKNTGATLWKAQVQGGGNGAAYSSAIVGTVGGVRQYIQFLEGGVVGVSATDGKVLWRFDAPATPRGINCSTPILQDDLVFAAAAYQHGGALGKLTKNGDTFSAEQVYFTREMRNHHGGMVVVNGYLYGFDENNLTCIDFKSGKTMWTDRSVGKGSVVYADGHLYCRSERGPVALVEANPEKYVEKGRFEQPDRSRDPSWAYPVIANGKMYLRDQGTLLCYDIKNP